MAGTLCYGKMMAWVKKSMSYEDDMERDMSGREGHERAWFEKGGCAGA